MPVHALVATSHSPLIGWASNPPAARPWHEHATGLHDAIETRDIDLVISFAVDHYTGIRATLVPPFTIVAKGTTIADFGGAAAELDIPEHAALDLSTTLVEEHFDVAVSHRFLTDHGTANALARFFDAPDAIAVIPIIINTLIPPAPSPRRCAALGTAVGRWASRRPERILLLASGGLSHDPTIIFPALGTDTTTDQHLLHHDGLPAWLDRVSELSELGGQLLAAGELQPDIRSDFDRRFLERYGTADPNAFDSWHHDDITNEGGPGATEINTWIAAPAAALAAHLPQPHVLAYSAVPEYGVGLALAASPTAPHRRDLPRI